MRFAFRKEVDGLRMQRTFLDRVQSTASSNAHAERFVLTARTDHPLADLSHERIQRRPVLGGLINEHERAA